MKILIIEDDERLSELIAEDLGDQNYTVETAQDGLSGWELASSFHYDLILLDIMLPKLDGISLCQRLRSQENTTPVLMLTARDTTTDKVVGLDAGADDYLVKPFELQELAARTRALLRRHQTNYSSTLKWGDLELDPNRCEVTYKDTLLSLTPKEYRLLEMFLRNGTRVFSRTQILDHLWAFESCPEEDTVRAHIKGLRQKLKSAGAPPDLIETVYGLGYRLKEI
ncbi:response regulator transcription factor [Euhalothece natronophila Z-M001]|uniref:Response regulator transcription factor n=1 Tax=Euhalothece natronophila Z-M001 TaxID=522448 RepID=A0A5B8NHX6_9CHRO|nr:response regulator transcription factor [Euhalothece natronophila]QDZ38487.1 response regulator transcription factor [Euhalothece natronophila Z-M001]